MTEKRFLLDPTAEQSPPWRNLLGRPLGFKILSFFL
jgi:hypothetical protein